MHRVRRKCSLWVAILLVNTLFAAHGLERTIVYSWPKSMQADERGSYPVELLKLALSKSNQSFIAQPSEHVMSQYRTLRQLELNKGIDVVWTMTNEEREKQLRPIRIPIDRGLIGWRLLAINKQDAELFNSVSTDSELKALLTVQGIDWPDFSILLDNGFKVTPSNYFNGMYQMLQKGRVRYFARSMTEIWLELASFQHHADVIDVAPRWVLHYPAALYFFVRKDDEQLALAIEEGLETSIRDGSMKALFLHHFHDSIIKSGLDKRQVVNLKNHGLPPQTPVNRAELWFNPKSGY